MRELFERRSLEILNPRLDLLVLDLARPPRLPRQVALEMKHHPVKRRLLHLRDMSAHERRVGFVPPEFDQLFSRFVGGSGAPGDKGEKQGAGDKQTQAAWIHVTLQLVRIGLPRESRQRKILEFDGVGERFDVAGNLPDERRRRADLGTLPTRARQGCRLAHLIKTATSRASN